MTIYDLISLFSDVWGDIEVYDLESNTTVFSGDYDDIPGYLDNAEVESIDWPNGSKLTINVSLEEDE